MEGDTNHISKKNVKRLTKPKLRTTSSSGSKCQVDLKTQINSTLGGNDSGIRVALIILNNSYALTSVYSDLPGVASDGISMREMLNCFDEIAVVENTSNFEKEIQDFCDKYKNKNVQSLHFHYSGHGVENATVEIDATSCTKAFIGGVTKTYVDGITPTGDCIVGCAGELYSVHDLKIELLTCTPERLTITLDCCRNRKRSDSVVVRLRNKGFIADSDLKKIALIKGTSEQHTASDKHTFTQELFKIYKEENGEIPILKIVSKVNQSWYERNIEQLCQHDIVEIGNNWQYFMWPASHIIKPKLGAGSGVAVAEKEKEKKEFEMERTVLNLADRLEKLECQNKKMEKEKEEKIQQLEMEKKKAEEEKETLQKELDNSEMRKRKQARKTVFQNQK